MRPPICALCGRDFRRDAFEGGGLVQFADHAPLPGGMTGHPRGLDWFCKRHLHAAQALQALPQGEALDKLRRKYWLSDKIRRLLRR